MKPAPLASESFNEWLKEELRELGQAVHRTLGDNLIALVLGGGYGRGEGAVTQVGDQEQPYNDLDLFLIVNDVKAVSGLETVAHEFEERLGIDVDFSRPLTPLKVSSLPQALMWHDLSRGHQVLWGDPNIISANAPQELKNPPPAGEAVRLLLNRGVGLLWAERVMKGLQNAPDQDFVRRNFFKAALSVGDSYFLANKLPMPHLSERASMISNLGACQQTVALYEKAIAFKLRPDNHTFNDHELMIKLWEQRFNHLLKVGVVDPEVSSKKNLFKNILRNLRVKRISATHPRSVLYSNLAVTRSKPALWPTLFDIWSKYH